ncbi:unnamed protein product [Phytophthora fragariaefolia]|uniref:Unnamed protein product n=1 Tax=Phytophthora fragariaefolia TaxID=1490495 RepID=A0A9W7D5Q5_9STRA|nr:unnamed protein product [Phytophthora fragariaefolia]
MTSPINTTTLASVQRQRHGQSQHIPPAGVSATFLGLVQHRTNSHVLFTTYSINALVEGATVPKSRRQNLITHSACSACNNKLRVWDGDANNKFARAGGELEVWTRSWTRPTAPGLQHDHAYGRGLLHIQVSTNANSTIKPRTTSLPTAAGRAQAPRWVRIEQLASVWRRRELLVRAVSAVSARDAATRLDEQARQDTNHKLPERVNAINNFYVGYKANPNLPDGGDANNEVPHGRSENVKATNSSSEIDADPDNSGENDTYTSDGHRTTKRKGSG